MFDNIRRIGRRDGAQGRAGEGQLGQDYRAGWDGAKPQEIRALPIATVPPTRHRKATLATAVIHGFDEALLDRLAGLRPSVPDCGARSAMHHAGGAG